jgi:hypothetical protein
MAAGTICGDETHLQNPPQEALSGEGKYDCQGAPDGNLDREVMSRERFERRGGKNRFLTGLGMTYGTGRVAGAGEPRKMAS